MNRYLRLTVVLLTTYSVSAFGEPLKWEAPDVANITLTYRVDIPGASGKVYEAKVADLRRAMSEFVKAGTVTEQSGQEQLKEQESDLRKGLKLDVDISSNGEKVLYRESAEGKLRRVVLLGKETRTYDVKTNRLDIVKGLDGISIDYWPYMPLNLKPLRLFGEPWLPAGFSLETVQKFGPTDVAVGVYRFRTTREREELVGTIVTLDTALKQPQLIRLEAGYFVHYSNYINVGDVTVPGQTEQTIYEVTAAPTKHPPYSLSSEPTDVARFTLVSHRPEALPAADFEIETYLPENATVAASDVILKFKPGKSVDAELSELRKLRPVPPKEKSSSLTGIAIAAGAGLILVSGGVALRMRLRR